MTPSVSGHPRFGAILFDCGDVLIDSEPIVNHLIQEMLIELGININLKDSIQRPLDKAIREELDTITEMCGAPPPPNWLSTFQA